MFAIVCLQENNLLRCFDFVTKNACKHDGDFVNKVIKNLGVKRMHVVCFASR